jgi:hypothetical protein
MPRYLFLETRETFERGNDQRRDASPGTREGAPCPYTPFVVSSLMAALARGESLEIASSGVMGRMPSQR